MSNEAEIFLEVMGRVGPDFGQWVLARIRDGKSVQDIEELFVEMRALVAANRGDIDAQLDAKHSDEG